MRLAAAIVALALVASPASACRLALVLGIDVSSSVDEREYALQQRGLAAALLAPEVRAAFFSSAEPVALYAYEWSGRWDQVELTPGWVLIDSPAALERAAVAIGTAERSRDDMPTALGYALGHAHIALRDAPSCDFRTVDISGDGVNNDGFAPEDAYRAADFSGVTVNGLVINGADFEGEVNLIEFYRTEVIRGPGAFVEIAAGFSDFERAMRRKLERELSVFAIGALPGGGRAG